MRSLSSLSPSELFLSHDCLIKTRKLPISLIQMPVELYHLTAFLISVTVVLWTIPDVKTVGLKLGIVDRPNCQKNS